MGLYVGCERQYVVVIFESVVVRGVFFGFEKCMYEVIEFGNLMVDYVYVFEKGYDF